MTTLVGNAPDQVPTNADLGSAAYLDATTVAIQTSAAGATVMASGTTAQRPLPLKAGMLRFNSETGQFEGYNGTVWGAIGGGGGLDVFLLMGA